MPRILKCGRISMVSLNIIAYRLTAINKTSLFPITANSTVRNMALDRYKNNTLLYIRSFSLYEWESGTSRHIAGNNVRDTANGIGSQAMLRGGELFQLNRSHWLMVDSPTCIKLVDIILGHVSEFAATCRVYDVVDGVGPEAKFQHAHSMIAHKYSDELILVSDYSAMRTLHLESRQVLTIYVRDVQRELLQSMIWHENSLLVIGYRTLTQLIFEGENFITENVTQLGEFNWLGPLTADLEEFPPTAYRTTFDLEYTGVEGLYFMLTDRSGRKRLEIIDFVKGMVTEVYSGETLFSIDLTMVFDRRISELYIGAVYGVLRLGCKGHNLNFEYNYPFTSQF